MKNLAKLALFALMIAVAAYLGDHGPGSYAYCTKGDVLACTGELIHY